MSDMVEQAIADAKLLREAALKSAESHLIERYAPKIKEAVENLLEKEEDELDLPFGDEEGMPEDEMGADTEEPAIEDELSLPPAHTEGERLCPCADEDEEIEIDFDQLRASMEQDPDVPGTEDVLDVEDDEFEMVEEALEQVLREMTGEDESDDEEIEVVEEDVEQIQEELTVDSGVVPSGQMAAGAEAVPEATRDYAKEIAAATANDDAMKQELKERDKMVKSLQERVETLSGQVKEKNSKLRKLSEHVKQQNLSNARLLYTNRVLNSSSLNERQRKRIVESISKAGTSEEMKAIYEALQDGVGAAKKKVPESLQETLSTRANVTSLLRERRGDKRDVDDDDPTVKHWQRLAGIKS